MSYKKLKKLCSKIENEYKYTFIINGWEFVLSTWNKYRYSKYYCERGDFTIYVLPKIKDEIFYFTRFPCYWFNHERQEFTVYYNSGRKNTEATKYTNYEELFGDGKTYKDFYKFQKYLVKKVNEHLLLRFQLDSELSVKQEIVKKKVSKI